MRVANKLFLWAALCVLCVGRVHAACSWSVRMVQSGGSATGWKVNAYINDAGGWLQGSSAANGWGLTGGSGGGSCPGGAGAGCQGNSFYCGVIQLWKVDPSGMSWPMGNQTVVNGTVYDINCPGTSNTNYTTSVSVTNLFSQNPLGGDYKMKFYTNGVLAATVTQNLGPGDSATWNSTNAFGAGVPYSYVLTGPGTQATDFVDRVVASGDATGAITYSTPPSPANTSSGTDVDSVAQFPSYTPASTNQLVADRQNTEALRGTLAEGFSELRKTMQLQGTNSAGGSSSVTNAPDYTALLQSISTNTLDSANRLSATTNFLGAATNLLTAITNLLPRYESTNSVNATSTAAAGEAAAYAGGGSSLSNNAGSLLGRTFTAAPSSGPNWDITIIGHTVSMNPVANADVAAVCAWIRYLVGWAAALITVWLVYGYVYAAILAVGATQQTKGVVEQTPIVGTIGTLLSSFGFRVAIVSLLAAATVVYWSSWLTANASIWNLVLSGQPFGTGFGSVVTNGIWLLDQFCPVVTVLTDTMLVLGSKLSLGAIVFIKTMAVRWFPS